MITLVLKELRELRPIAVLLFALVVFGYFVLPFFERLDELTFIGLCSSACDAGIDYFSAWLSLLLILATAYCLFPREFDTGTIDYLRALPISFASLFFAKFIAAAVLIVCFELLAYLFGVAWVSLNPDSIEGGYYHAVELRYLVLMFVFLFVVLSHGIFLSWFRMTGIIVYAMAMLFVSWLELVKGGTSLLNVFELMRFEYQGSTLQLPIAAMMVQLPIAVLLLAASYWLWRDSKSSNRLSSTRQGFRTKLLFRLRIFLVMMLLVVTCAALVWRYTQQESQTDNPARSMSTEHFTFFYRANRESVVERLQERADDLLGEMAVMLGTESIPTIVVDGTRTSDHYAGTAGWKRIRMDLSASTGIEKTQRILVHEAAHVYQSLLSDGNLKNYNNRMRFFIEGMAEFVSHQLVPDKKELHWSRLVASVAASRQNLGLAELSDDSGFTARYATELVYPLGETWVQALVDVCGDSINGELLRLLDSDEQSHKLTGVNWWTSVLQQLGCDSGLVVQQWKTQRDMIMQHQDVSFFPELEFRGFSILTQADERVSAAIDSSKSGQAGEIRAEFLLRNGQQDVQGNTPAVFLLRIREHASDGPERLKLYRGALVGDEVHFTIPDTSRLDGRFSFQVGYRPVYESTAYYQPWQSGDIKY